MGKNKASAREKNNSKLSNTKGDKVEKVVKTVEIVEEKSRYGVSIPTAARGFLIAPDNFIMCEEIFDLLFERFDEAQMKKRIEGEFKGYSIKNAIQTTMNAVNMQTITNDIGDDFTKRPEIELDNYDYDEESTEPVAAKLCSHGV